jgi:NAD(P)-dependent dehydrogenase (short-subunit alcohol dehydrogenase family)
MTENRVGIVTGGAQGIGRITAEFMISEGFGVAVWDYDAEALAEEKERWKEETRWLGILCDVSSEREVSEAVKATLSHYGRLDILINNAAIHANKPLCTLSVGEWKRVIDINLTGALICSKLCEAELRKTKGSVVNICSTRAFQSEAHTEAYSASKGGLYSLTHALAVSLGPDIRVNSVSPGWIDVSSVRKLSAAKQIPVSSADHNQHPAGRVGEGADIARMIMFLCNPSNNFITGQNFIIDGGMTRKMIYV